MIQVKPIDDIREHDDCDCWCDPEVEWLDEDGLPLPKGPLVIHNSASDVKAWGVFECIS